MPDVKISGLTDLTGSVATDDVLAIVDTSDPAQSALTGSTRKITVAKLNAAPVTVTDKTGSTPTIAAADAGCLLTFSNSTGSTTATLATALNLTKGQRIDMIQTGTAQVTIAVGTSNGTLSGTPGLKLRAQYSAATLICLQSTPSYIYVLVGDLTA